MIKIEKVSVYGLEEAIRGMRNPMNSWNYSDSYHNKEEYDSLNGQKYVGASNVDYCVGYNDNKLMINLASGGPVHAKYRRMITVYLDITAPLYWWKEFDTYKVGTVANSCSTMHKIHAKEFTLEDFSHEHLIGFWETPLRETIEMLNKTRDLYLESNKKDKELWYRMIQLLPSSYNQKRTVMLNYEVLVGIYRWRKEHKLNEWREFCRWIEQLPYSEIIIGKKEESDE
ncbi:hypothetical protein [uncultured Bacteroides sp.]|uniref:hypothetical protein n=1 Tax=uncultured Bacteroides sp. TaxID=162156 RepID=UPI00272D68C1|nr:hypothetical protein [uncultured Bacteroides sp.]